jgi:hypothetical protein
MQKSISTFLLLFFAASGQAQFHTLLSPDGRLEVTINTGEKLEYSVQYAGKPLLDSCRASLLLQNGQTLGRQPRLRKQERRSVRDTIVPVVPEKRARIPDVFEELILHFQGNYAVVFRAYDDGVAYRFTTAMPDSITIIQEDAVFQFAGTPLITYPAVWKRPDADSFHTSFEAPYKTCRLDTMPGDLAFSPVLLSTEKLPHVLITESDLLGYPGMFLRRHPDGGLRGVFAPYPKHIEVTTGEFPQQIVTDREPWIARCAGARTYPWRVIVVAPEDADLVRNDLVYRLDSPNRLPESPWIRPGTSTEEWIIGSNIYGVPFEAGINTNTYKYYMTDFMDRDDQHMVQFYERIAEATAKYKIMVMFHGAFKPAGLQRTYPHLITREGALGSEFNIWSDLVTPRHDLLLPFIRQASGPMDYEPGILDNATQKTFRPIGEKVMSQGTRAHQLALFIAYESPLQMFSGNPSKAYEEPAFMELLGSLPTVWDETRVVEAKIGERLVLARRRGDNWYLASINDWTPVETTVALDFLPAGVRFRATICADGANAHRYASDYTISERFVGATDRLAVRLAPGGGWVVRLEWVGE